MNSQSQATLGRKSSSLASILELPEVQNRYSSITPLKKYEVTSR